LETYEPGGESGYQGGGEALHFTEVGNNPGVERGVPKERLTRVLYSINKPNGYDIQLRRDEHSNIRWGNRLERLGVDAKD